MLTPRNRCDKLYKASGCIETSWKPVKFRVNPMTDIFVTIIADDSKAALHVPPAHRRRTSGAAATLSGG
jgi:hypothetical protein